VRRRLDVELVRRGLVSSRRQAGELVDRGAVRVGGAVADKASRLVAGHEAIVVESGGPRFVSRGGDKLDAALARFAISARGRRCLDAGASTGGFTDCLLRRGASRVVAVDVGYGQLHPRLRGDHRVEVRERTNVRRLGDEAHGERFDLVVADLSFVSLTGVVPTLVGRLAGPAADLVVLVKPQFEVGRVEAGRGRGVVHDPALRRRALGSVASALVGAGATIMGAMASPLLGPAGNAEYLVWARRAVAAPGPVTASASSGLDEMLDAAVAQSPDRVAPSTPGER